MELLHSSEERLNVVIPEQIRVANESLEAIRGGNAKENADILLSVLQNQASPYLETTVLNAGLGFYANGKSASIEEGIALARQVIASGAAYEKLKQLQEYQK